MNNPRIKKIIPNTVAAVLVHRSNANPAKGNMLTPPTSIAAVFPLFFKFLIILFMIYHSFSLTTFYQRMCPLKRTLNVTNQPLIVKLNATFSLLLPLQTCI